MHKSWLKLIYILPLALAMFFFGYGLKNLEIVLSESLLTSDLLILPLATMLLGFLFSFVFLSFPIAVKEKFRLIALIYFIAAVIFLCGWGFSLVKSYLGLLFFASSLFFYWTSGKELNNRLTLAFSVLLNQFGLVMLALSLSIAYTVYQGTNSYIQNKRLSIPQTVSDKVVRAVKPLLMTQLPADVDSQALANIEYQLNTQIKKLLQDLASQHKKLLPVIIVFLIYGPLVLALRLAANLGLLVLRLTIALLSGLGIIETVEEPTTVKRLRLKN